MKVKELIAKLSEFDPDLRVFTYDSSYWDEEVTSVSLDEFSLDAFDASTKVPAVKID